MKARYTSYAFWVAHLRCAEPRPLPPEIMGPIMTIPDQANIAFSIELGFKALTMHAGGSAHGHKLHELFDLLPASHQASIRTRVGLTEAPFAVMIDRHHNDFVKWRYFHETPDEDTLAPYDFEFLLSLGEAVQEELNQTMLRFS